MDNIKQKLSQRNEQGFTIIEVVLVLAIAGLIFLVVFLAVPQLQRSQRDSQRRSDLGRFMTSLETYSSNNNGQYPELDDATVSTNFVNNYLTNSGSEFSDPLEGDYTINASGSLPGTIDDDDIGTIYFRDGQICGDNEGEITSTGANTRNVAALIPLENGVAYCQDNR